MKRAWRWPFAGFVVGALVGATILTVNVVGASSPERPPAGAGSFGEILHTPVLLARAGEPVELRYDVVCGAPQVEPRAACSPKGSVFIRPEGRARRSSSIRSPRPRRDCSPPRCREDEAPPGFDYYAEIENGAGQTARLPEGAPPRHRITSGRFGVGPRSPSDEPFRGTRAPDSVVAGSRGARASMRSGSTAAASSRGSGRRHSTSPRRLDRRARPGQPAARRHARRQAKRAADRVRRRRGRPRRRPRRDDLRARRGWSGAQRRRLHRRRSDRRDAAGRAERRHGAGGSRGPIVHAYPSEMWLPTGAGRPPLTRRSSSPARDRRAASVTGSRSWSARPPTRRGLLSFVATASRTRGS